MKEQRKTRAQLTTELAELRLRLNELETAHQQEPAQKRNAELSLANRALQALTSTLNLNEVLSLVLNELRQMLTISASSIWLLDSDGAELVCRNATGPHNELVRGWRMPSHNGFAGWAVQNNQSLIIADALSDPRHFEGVDRRTGLTMRSLISVPLRLAEKQVIGVIQAADVQPDRFTLEDLRLTEMLATAASAAIANARLFEKTWQRAERLAMLHELSTVLNTPAELHQVLSAALSNLTRVLKVDQTGLALMDEGREHLTIVADVPTPDNASMIGWQIPVAGNRPMEVILESKAPIVIADAPHDPLVEHIRDVMTQRRIQSMLLVPLLLHGEVIGTLGCDAVNLPRQFTTEDIELATTVANMIVARIEQARLFAAERDQRMLAEKHARELEQRVAERTHDLREANEQLRGLDRMKDQFVSRISHELLTPLANVKLYANLLEQGRPEKRLQYLETLHQEADRLGRLIDDLLDMSHLSTATEAIDLFPIDLNRFVRDLVSERQGAARARGLTLECELDLSLTPTPTSLPRLAKAVSNLLANAINYTFQGGIVIATGTQAAGERTWVTLAVRDTGVGIDPEEAHRIFDRFYRGLAASDYKVPGAGLGLSVARANIERLGGRITFESQLGRGSVFTIWLPLVEAASGSLGAGSGSK